LGEKKVSNMLIVPKIRSNRSDQNLSVRDLSFLSFNHSDLFCIS